jgi:GABA(A) receptor-associated protein
MKFKTNYTFEKRFEESSRIIRKHPDRLPVICEKSNEKNKIILPTMNKTKYLVPLNLTISEFLFLLRNRMKLPPEMGIFLFIGNTIASNTSTFEDLYNQFKDPDGFLYIIYSGENVFG